MRDLDVQLNDSQKEHNLHPSDDLQARITSVRAALEAILKSNAVKSLMHAQHCVYKFGVQTKQV